MKSGHALRIMLVSLALIGQGCPALNAPETITADQETAPSIPEKVFTFKHVIGKTDCPTPVGSIDFRQDERELRSWRVQPESPVAWLNMGITGQAEHPLEMSFNCELEKYETQNVETTLLVTLTLQNGTTRDIRVRVKGQIQK